MTTGFPSQQITLTHQTDAESFLAGEFVYFWRGRRFRCPPGASTDGMSDPHIFHCVPDGDPYGWALVAAVPHDCGYRDTLEVEVNGEWVKASLTKDECDAMLKELLETIADTTARQVAILAIYEAVHLGGAKAFNEDRNKC